MYEKENPLCGKESPDLNPLYPECSIENNTSYTNYPETETRAEIQKPQEPVNIDVAQTGAENMVVDDYMAQDTVVISSPNVCDDEPPETRLSANEGDDVPDAEACSSPLEGDAVGSEARLTPEYQQVPDVNSAVKAITISMPERDIVDSDTSEVYLTPTEATDSERKPASETVIRNKTEHHSVDESVSHQTAEEVDSIARQCNGFVEKDSNENHVESAIDISQESSPHYDEGVEASEPKCEEAGEEVSENAEDCERSEENKTSSDDVICCEPNRTDVSDGNISDPASPLPSSVEDIKDDSNIPLCVDSASGVPETESHEEYENTNSELTEPTNYECCASASPELRSKSG